MNTEGFDHIPCFGWTSPARLSFNKDMNTTSLLQTQGRIRLFIPQGAAGSSASAYGTEGYRACACHTVVENGREAITALARSDKELNNTARTSLAEAQRIDWSGNAADMYRKRLQTFAAAMDAYDCDATTAAQLAQGGAL